MVARPRAALLGVVLLWLAPGAAGAAGAATPAAVEPAARRPGAGMRLYTQRAYSKVREGSLLARRERQARPLELRGAPEMARDAEQILHFGRLADLDALADLARRSGETRLIERLEVALRSETQRHFRLMQQILHTATPPPASVPSEPGAIFRRASDRAHKIFDLSGLQSRIEALEATLKNEKDAVP